MEKSGVSNTRYEKQFVAAANVLQNDGSKEVYHLKQTCTPKGAAWKYVTTVTDVMILNYAVSLDVARGIQWDPIQYPGRVVLYISYWQSSCTTTRPVAKTHVRLE